MVSCSPSVSGRFSSPARAIRSVPCPTSAAVFSSGFCRSSAVRYSEKLRQLVRHRHIGEKRPAILPQGVQRFRGRRGQRQPAVSDHLRRKSLKQPVSILAGMENHRVGMAMDINEPRHSRLPVGIQNPPRRLSAVLFSVGKYNGIPWIPMLPKYGCVPVPSTICAFLMKKSSITSLLSAESWEAGNSPGFPQGVYAFL